MKSWKKNVIAAALLVAVCGGIYINWLYTENTAVVDLVDTLDESKVLSADLLVMNSDVPIDNDYDTTLSAYFASVRLSRQEARDSAVGLLQEAMAYGDSKDVSASNTKLEQIVQMALCEAQIESLVIAKGYQDCVAYISDDGISVAVAVPEGGFTQSDVAVIADIVMTQSDFSLEDIHIVEVY